MGNAMMPDVACASAQSPALAFTSAGAKAPLAAGCLPARSRTEFQTLSLAVAAAAAAAGATAAAAGPANRQRLRSVSSSRTLTRRAIARWRDSGAAEAEVVSPALQLVDLKTSDLKRQLMLSGLDTSASFDRESLLELATGQGLLPESRARSRRQLMFDFPTAPVMVALRRVAAAGQYIPSGPFTDGERLAIPLWSEGDFGSTPMWFVLDTAIRNTVLSVSTARRLGVESSGGTLTGLRFGNEPVGPLKVTLVPDGAPVLGDPAQGVAGLVGPDFLFGWDLDLDVPRGRCAAWPSGPELPRGFGPLNGIEVELVGRQGLLELTAQLRGTVCSGSAEAGPPVRAVVDLGQTYSACNWAAARQVGVDDASSPCVRRAGQWRDLSGNMIEVCEADLGVEIPGRVSGVLRSARVCETRLFWLADRLPLLERMGFDQSTPCVVLGLDTVGRARLSISARHRRMLLPHE
mmetsp:Transcript_27023/g.89720  ORF Transcript_27023/g.89720 Transcript_27023/m.89720 type:complete len:463 (-) Transcript_27023:63-1451(-)